MLLATDLDKLLNPAVLIFVVGGLIAIVAIVAYYLHDYAKDRGQKELKQIMLKQGKSVEEIERVLQAGKETSTDEKEADGKGTT